MAPSFIAWLFAGLATVFFVLALTAGGRSSTARRTWIRIGVIFAIVTLYLFYLHGRSGP